MARPYAEPMQRHVDEEIYLPSLIQGARVGDAGCVLTGHHFIGCTLYGPALVRFLDSGSMAPTCTIAGDPDDLLVVDDRNLLIGVVGVIDCVFEFTRFVGIGFSCSSDEIDDVRAGVRRWVT